MNSITKNIIARTQGLLLFIFIAILLVGWKCKSVYREDGWRWCREFSGELLGLLGFVAGFVVFITLPALLTLPFQEVVFERWKRFAGWAIPFVIVITILTLIFGDSWDTSTPGSFHMGALVFPLLYGWYFLHSLILITLSAIKSKNTIA
jgi:MFS family permease